MREKRIGAFNILPIAWKLWRRVPVAKIINRKWFYGLPFYTNKHTLDPRPDSETLVEAVLANEKNARHILDLGTGSGCLLCAILKNMPHVTGVGIDKSFRARRVAQRNISELGLADRAWVVKGTFRGIGVHLGSADVIISNPPYIPDGDLRVDRGARHDPRMALYGGADGLKFYREIALLGNVVGRPSMKADVAFHRKATHQEYPRLKLYLEIGVGQGAAVTKIFRDAGWQPIAQFKDLSGRVRTLSFAK